MSSAFLQGPTQSDEDKKLAAENVQLKRVVVKLEMQKELLENALETERNKRVGAQPEREPEARLGAHARREPRTRP